AAVLRNGRRQEHLQRGFAGHLVGPLGQQLHGPVQVILRVQRHVVHVLVAAQPRFQPLQVPGILRVDFARGRPQRLGQPGVLVHQRPHGRRVQRQKQPADHGPEGGRNAVGQADDLPRDVDDEQNQQTQQDDGDDSGQLGDFLLHAATPQASALWAPGPGFPEPRALSVSECRPARRLLLQFAPPRTDSSGTLVGRDPGAGADDPPAGFGYNSVGEDSWPFSPVFAHFWRRTRSIWSSSSFRHWPSRSSAWRARGFSGKWSASSPTSSAGPARGNGSACWPSFCWPRTCCGPCSSISRATSPTSWRGTTSATCGWRCTTICRNCPCATTATSRRAKSCPGSSTTPPTSSPSSPTTSRT